MREPKFWVCLALLLLTLGLALTRRRREAADRRFDDRLKKMRDPSPGPPPVPGEE
jgi:hypothetical protein